MVLSVSWLLSPQRWTPCSVRSIGTLSRTARLRCSSKGFCFAIRHDGGDDIYIRDHQLNHAWNGDRVLVRITREGSTANARLQGANTGEDLRQTLRILGSTASSELMALEVIWQPEGRGDVLSAEELITAYPNLQHL